MANDKLIKVSEETKEAIEGLKNNKLKASSEGAVVGKLVEYYNKNHIELTGEVSKQLEDAKSFFKIRNDSDVVKLLLHHFQESNALSKETFKMAANMRY